ncbi:MAG: ABC transporter ATP-binding protein [Acetobacteraceae bacterium]
MTPVLELADVTHRYEVSRPFLQRLLAREERNYLRAVDDVSFTIKGGETLSLVGESGCGKSTLARLVVGLMRPSSGSIRLFGQDLMTVRRQPALRRRVNMVFQNPYASLNPRWRVRDIIQEPIRVFGLLPSRRRRRERIDELLLHVGLTPADGDRFPHQFSGGQRQRIAIARALASEPSFLVADEPTSALDVSVQAQILNLLRDLQSRLNLTVLFISHNLAVVRHMSDRLGVMYLGRIVEIGPAETVFAAPLHPYTRLLLEAVPMLDQADRTRSVPEDDAADPLAPPSGCAFHPRCPLADARCRRERPTVTRVRGVDVACHAVAEGRVPAQ